MILLDSYYDSGENEVLFMKIGVRVPDLRLDILLGPSCPKLVFRPQTPNFTALEFKNFLTSISIKVCMKQTLVFKFWVIFDKVMSVYSHKIAKNPSKIFFFLPFQISKFSLSLVKKNPPFLEH